MNTIKIIKRNTIFLFVAMSFFLLSLAFVSSYTISNPALTQGTFQPTAGNIDLPFQMFNREMCGAGQDFILQIDPLGCSPTVVRSDLLEEQNVPVFCPVVATKINPLIDINAIDRITFQFNGPQPKEVQSVTYFPSRAALVSPKLQLNEPVLNDLGYVVITLRRQPNETAMPDFVTGNLTAKLRYNIKNAFGVGQATYYLPEISDEDEWNEKQVQYGFWHGRGYLRAENIEGNSATISIYSDREAYSTKKSGDKRKIAGYDIEVGKTSPEIPMPGFNYCLGSMEIQLKGLVEPGTRAKLRVNEDVLEVKEGELFLDNKCTVKTIEKIGVLEKTTIKCKEDDKSRQFKLVNNPKIRIKIDGVEKEVSVGDNLYFSDDPNKKVYLGYISTKAGTGKEEDLYVRLVKTPDRGPKLSDDILNQVARFDDKDVSYSGGTIRKASNFVVGKIKTGTFVFESFIKYLGSGTDPRLDPLYIGKEYDDVFGSKVTVLGFASPIDVVLEGDTKINYNKAKQDYETVIDSYSAEIYPKTGDDERTLGEKALYNYIQAAWSTNQKKTTVELCKQFSEEYPDSTQIPAECDNALGLASPESNAVNVLINGKTYLVNFDSILEPTQDEYGAEIIIEKADEKCNGAQTLGLNEEGCFSDTEFIKLVKIEDSAVEFDVRSVKESTTQQIFWKTNNLRLKEKESFVLGDKGYKITVNKINLKKLAKVEVKPNIHLTETKADFKFKVGIEKRLIKLSPEKTKERIESLNKTIEKWKGINARLGTVVQYGKAACFLTSGALTAKNFLDNLGGKGIARQKAMRGDKGWFDICENGVNQKAPVNGKVYTSVDQCLLGNSAAVEATVNAVADKMKIQNDQLEELQKKYKLKDGFLGEDIINTDGMLKELVGTSYKQEVNQALQGKFANGQMKVGNENVDVSQVVNSLSEKTVTLSQARDLQLNSRLLSSTDPTARAIAQAQINKTLADIYVNSRTEIQRQNTISTLTGIGLENLGVSVYSGKDTINEPYNGEKTTETIGRLKAGSEAAVISYKNTIYLVQLKKINDIDYQIIGVYDQAGNTVPQTIEDEIKPKFNFKHYNENTYVNPYASGAATVRYFEQEPYRGLPAVVPFDLDKGWYAAIKSTLAVGSNIRAYGDSGRVSSMYLCNIGPNRREEGIGIGDDICQMINLGTGQPFNQFPGIENRAKAEDLVRKAVSAIEQASIARANNPKVSQVTINGRPIKVGPPATSTPDIQCQDFMSPTDCNILFNVCDPVICPSSRCDLGGAYPVQDVVQSGVAGSLMLCLPNFPEIKVPICLSGVYAGLEGYLTVLDSYQQCLQTSLDNGQTVGVCDEIHSVYMCDFFWRQGLPVANLIVPKAISAIRGQNSQGGGEYLGVEDAWKRAGDSVNYFKQYYAADSFKAFKARSVQEVVGTEICKNWLSLSAPGGGNLLDALTKPDVPAQFLGSFDEIPYTSATNPPTSQYKVFYHIYAGKDFPAYYQVYLKGTPGTFFQDTDVIRVVASGFIPVGQFESKTPDLIAPSGYKELCIRVNNQEECGFKQVTTEFGINYLTEKFVAQQASQKDIKSESACISGTPSLLALSPNIQSTAESAINPQLYNRGIIRICSSDNPGKGTDPFVLTDKSRWLSVGYCGNENIKCWLDRESVTDTLRNTNLENEVLQDVSQDYLTKLGQNVQVIDEDTFGGIVKSVTEEKDPVKKIEIIGKSYNQIVLGHQKGYITLLRGDAYAEIAKSLYEKMRAEATSTPQKATEPAPVGTTRTGSPIFEFRDGTFDSNLYYTFYKDQWYYSRLPNMKDSKSVNAQIDSKELNNKEDEAFIKSLRGLDYQDGLSLLIKRVVPKSFARDPTLNTRSIEYSANKRFNLKIRGIVYQMEYNENLKKWRWSFDEKTWMNVPDTIIKGSSFSNFEGKEPINEVVDLIKSLDGKNALGGAEDIFAIDSDTGLIFTDLKEEDVVERSFTGSKPFFDYVPKELSDQYFGSRTVRDATPEYIVLHHTGGATAASAIETLIKSGNSINYLVDKNGDVITMVPDDQAAQHANCVNSISVGIEIVNKGDGKDPYPKTQQESLTKLLDYLIKKYDIKPGNVIGHGCTNPSKDQDEPKGLETNFMYIENPDFPIGYDVRKASTGNCLVRCENGNPIITGTPVTPITSALSCSTDSDCQKVLGREIMRIANEMKAGKGNPSYLSDAQVKADTGAKNFACLTLMVAMGESGGTRIQHCDAVQQNGNPLYCNGDPDTVIGGDATQGGSFGAFQINKDAHPAAYPEVYDFETNVKYGVNKLITDYSATIANCDASPAGCAYKCYRPSALTGSPVRAEDFQTKLYSGWQRAIRKYNGWNTQCISDEGGEVGNPRYVDYILSRRTIVESAFPECV